MFKRSVVIGILSAAALAFLLLPRLLDELFVFLFIGIIPYSTHAVPFWWMLAIDITLVWLGARWLRTQLTLLANSKKRELKKRQIARAEVYRMSRKLAQRRTRLARTEARASRRSAQPTAEASSI